MDMFSPSSNLTFLPDKGEQGELLISLRSNVM